MCLAFPAFLFHSRRKLFIGQVPFEANEADLWPLFSSIGNVLELVVLRTPQVRNEGLHGLHVFSTWAFYVGVWGIMDLKLASSHGHCLDGLALPPPAC